MGQGAPGEIDGHAVAAAAMDGVAVTVGDEIVHANEALGEIVGQPDLVGSPWRALFHPEARERLDGVRSSVDADGQWRGEMTLRRDDGRTVQTEVSATDGDDDRTLIWAVRETGLVGEAADRLDRYETIIDTAEDGIYSLDESLEFAYVNDALCEMVGLEAAEMVGRSVSEFFVYDDEYAFAEEVRERVLNDDTSVGTVQGAAVTQGEGTRYFETRYRLHPEPDGEFQGSVGVVRDVTDRVERERELETLNRINELLLETVREAIHTTTRAAVESTVCERLLELDRYGFAWIGDRPLDGGEVVPQTTAGGDDSFLEELAISVEATDGGASPVELAIREQTVHVANIEALGPSAGRSVVAERGFESELAAPIHYEDTVYGVLVVYSTEADAFTEREQAGFAILGETFGYVVNAIKNRQLLVADTVVELTFDVNVAEGALFRQATELGCRIDLGGLVETGSRTLLYADVEGVAVDRFVHALEGADAVARSRVITDDGDGGRVELAFAEPFLVDTVLSAGATVEAARIEPGGGRVVVEAPAAADTRALVNHIQAGFDQVELVARRQRNRPPGPGEPEEDPFAGVTDRQREALEVAFNAGYFDWPRASTAEEVADTMDIAAPTLHYHLRKAEDGLLRSVFE